MNPSPVATTRPEPSSPGISGKDQPMPYCPSIVIRSDGLIGEAAIRTSTSPAPGVGTGRSSTRGVAPGASTTSARIVLGRSDIGHRSAPGEAAPEPATPARHLANAARAGISGATERMHAMKLWVGLGNPGARYAGNRHNIGWMAVERIAADHGFGPWRAKFQGAFCEGTLGGDKVLLLKPETFMNLSGQSVGEAMRFYKLTPADITVFHDELDLAPGKVRLKEGGGHAGHNGLRSIHQHIGEAYAARAPRDRPSRPQGPRRELCAVMISPRPSRNGSTMSFAASLTVRRTSRRGDGAEVPECHRAAHGHTPGNAKAAATKPPERKAEAKGEGESQTRGARSRRLVDRFR
jgi:hypothetical protein